MDLPLRNSRSSGVLPQFVCDNSKYVFGVEKLKDNEREKLLADESKLISVIEDSGTEAVLVSRRSMSCFEAFKDLHHKLLDDLDDPGVSSFLKFLDCWKPETLLENPKIAEYKNDIFAGANFVFECGGGYLHNDSAVRHAWEKYSSSESDCEMAQCLVSGEYGPVSKLHQKIKGVPGSNSAGAPLVSFNNKAFESYGKENCFNAPVSDSLMFEYSTVLNYLLASRKNRLRLADTTAVFWAETDDDACEDLANFFFDPREVKEDESDPDQKVRDLKTLRLVGDILKKVKTGQKIKSKDIGADSEANFCILGLSPNNARLAIRFWYQDSFGNFVERLSRHHLDMEIVRDDSGPGYISLYRLLNETVPKSSESKEVSPILGGLIMRSILNDTVYPVQMYNAILNRVKVERSINYVRAGFIKAYLLRLARSGSGNLNEDLITVSLNEDSLSVPYRLGRLFAVLEKVQGETNKNMKSTINSKYFSSAATTPAVVFPVLLKLGQHHIAKSDWGFVSSKLIEEILSGVDNFPEYLNLEDQGMFMLGYYHQRKDFFRKKENNPVKEE